MLNSRTDTQNGKEWFFTVCQDDCPSFGFLGLRGKCGLILILFFALVNKTITSDDQHVVSLTLWLLSLLHEANCHFDVETITKIITAPIVKLEEFPPAIWREFVSAFNVGGFVTLNQFVLSLVDQFNMIASVFLAHQIVPVIWFLNWWDLIESRFCHKLRLDNVAPWYLMTPALPSMPYEKKLYIVQDFMPLLPPLLDGLRPHDPDFLMVIYAFRAGCHEMVYETSQQQVEASFTAHKSLKMLSSFIHLHVRCSLFSGKSTSPSSFLPTKSESVKSANWSFQFVLKSWTSPFTQFPNTSSFTQALANQLFFVSPRTAPVQFSSRNARKSFKRYNFPSSRFKFSMLEIVKNALINIWILERDNPTRFNTFQFANDLS